MFRNHIEKQKQILMAKTVLFSMFLILLWACSKGGPSTEISSDNSTPNTYKDSVFVNDITVEEWGVFEFKLMCSVNADSAFDVSINAVFSQGETEKKVAGFYNGNGEYLIRFMPDKLGVWSFVTSSGISKMDNQKGRFKCIPPSPGNHGPVRVIDQFHFAYADGKRFFPVGTTLYCWLMERYDETLATLKNGGINKVRFMPFPHNGNTFPPFNPWEGSVNNWDFDRPNPKFWQFIENAVRNLGERGVQADFIFFHPYESGTRKEWGLGPEQMTALQRENYLKYAVARLAAYKNVWWSMANEFDLIDKRESYWEPLAETVVANDPYNHMISIHGRPNVHYPGWDNSWVTHISIQSPNVDNIVLWRSTYQKPIVDDEYQYEGNVQNWGNLTGQEATKRAWIATINGGYVTHGESYSPYNFFWKGGTPQRFSFARVSWLSKEVLNNDSKLLPEGLTLLDNVSAKAGNDYYLYYFGEEVTSEKSFTMPEGKEYQVDVLDTWNMTVAEMDGIYSGTFTIKWPSGKYMAVRIFNSKNK